MYTRSVNAHIMLLIVVVCTWAALGVHRSHAYVVRHEPATAPTSALASKVIYQSQPPSLDNVYKEFMVSSKPLTLRKYNTNGGGPKTKKTKKDSKIYFISIPALPYRYTPGIGYDYQPMKINPILMSKPPAAPNAAAGDDDPHQNAEYQKPMGSATEPQRKPPKSQTPKEPLVSTASTAAPLGQADSQIYHLNRGDYYFNGRPFRLQVAHAQRKHSLTPQNIKSNFYYDKNIIY